MKGLSGRSQPTTSAPGSPEEVLDAVFDFAEHMIEQQRAFAKQMLKAASKGQEIASTAGDGASGLALVIGTQHPGGATCYVVGSLGGAARRNEGKLTFEVERPAAPAGSHANGQSVPARRRRLDCRHSASSSATSANACGEVDGGAKSGSPHAPGLSNGSS